MAGVALVLSMSAIWVDRDLSEWFITILGVMQGCVLSQLLFNILLEVVLALALENNEFGAKVSGFCISNLHFADDICLIAEGTDNLQCTVDKVHTTGNRFGLEVSRTKTEVQCIGREKQQMKTLIIIIRQLIRRRNMSIKSLQGRLTLLGVTELTQCEEFVYLGGVVSADDFCDRDVDRRIGLAAGIVRNLHSIWKTKDISKSSRSSISVTGPVDEMRSLYISHLHLDNEELSITIHNEASELRSNEPATNVQTDRMPMVTDKLLISLQN